MPDTRVIAEALAGEAYVFLALRAERDVSRATQALAAFQRDWNRWGQQYAREALPTALASRLSYRLPTNGQYDVTTYTVLLSMLQNEGNFEPSVLRAFPPPSAAGRLGVWFLEHLEPRAYQSIGAPWFEQVLSRPAAQAGATLNQIAMAYVLAGGGSAVATRFDELDARLAAARTPQAPPSAQTQTTAVTRAGKTTTWVSPTAGTVPRTKADALTGEALRRAQAAAGLTTTKPGVQIPADSEDYMYVVDEEEMRFVGAPGSAPRQTGFFVAIGAALLGVAALVYYTSDARVR